MYMVSRAWVCVGWKRELVVWADVVVVVDLLRVVDGGRCYYYYS